jgi:hypothetical protein
MYHYISLGKILVQTLTRGHQIAPDVFQNVMSKLTKDIEYVKAFLDDLLILNDKV